MSRLRAAHGARRRRIARLGGVVALASTVAVFALGAGLANAQGETPSIPGLAQHAHDQGPGADSHTISAIRNQTHPGGISGTSGPTGVTGSTTTSAPSGSSGPTGPTPTTVLGNDPLSQAILAIGDSVMLGAEDSLHRAIPGIFVDAKVSRQFWDATFVVQAYKNEGLLPGTIVIHMGTNGAFRDDQFEQLMSVIGPSRHVWFVNAHEPRPWEKDVNDRLYVDSQRYPNARVIDWHLFSSKHPEWFVADGIHLTGAGAQAYADFIREHIRKDI